MKTVQGDEMTHCPVSNNGFGSFWFGMVLFGEFDGRSPSVFVKQIIHDLVASCIVIDIYNSRKNLEVS